MRKLTYRTRKGNPRKKYFETLAKGLKAHHASKGHERVEAKFSIFVEDADGNLLGGIIYTILWNGMKIDSLWVEESTRGTGLGRKLLTKAEKKALEKGCKVAYTDTFTWQAPGFYEKMGYSVYGKLEGYPEGNSLLYVSKSLG